MKIVRNSQEQVLQKTSSRTTTQAADPAGLGWYVGQKLHSAVLISDFGIVYPRWIGC